MASYTAVQDTPIFVDLIQQAHTTGWSLPGDGTAKHDTCNDGNIRLLTFPITEGDTYEISYEIISISSGNLQLFCGTTAGSVRTTTGNYVETLLAGGTNPVISFYSNANCVIRAFNIRNTVTDTNPNQQNTLLFSLRVNKWVSFLTLTPDIGYSMYSNMYTFNQGNQFNHLNGSSNDRNNFYGVQYNSILTLLENSSSTVAKTFERITYQANSLLITTTDGITTSLGQVSELVSQDFLQFVMNDGISTVSVYTLDGLYSATFLRDKNVDIINGDPLKGNWMTVELTTDVATVALQLFSVGIEAVKSYNNIR